MKLPEPALGHGHTMNRLRRASACIERLCAAPACSAEEHVDVSFVLATFERFEDQARTGLTLDAAFGLGKPRGGMSWVRQQANAERDRQLRHIRTHHLGGLDDAAAVSAILNELQALDRRSDLRAGTFTGDVARAELCARVPRSKKQLGCILHGNRNSD